MAAVGADAHTLQLKQQQLLVKQQELQDKMHLSHERLHQVFGSQGT